MSFKKTVILKDWRLDENDIINRKQRPSPQPGINVIYREIDKQNQECYATVKANTKAQEPKDDVNNQLEKLSKYLLSDRGRLPRFKKRHFDVKQYYQRMLNG